MIEFELKFQIPPQQRDAMHAFVSGKPGASHRQRLQAIYFDTADRSLARAQMALRLRREGDRWVQTLKGVGVDGIGREESDIDLGQTGDREPALDPQRHAGEAIGQRLIKLLGTHPLNALRCSFRSDVRRVTRLLRSRHGQVELAFDEGDLQADGERASLCELEIELKRGHPLAVIDVARRWALRHRCWLDVRSKAERGDMLARGLAMAPPRKASRVKLDPDSDPFEALRVTIVCCRDQILANASQIASGRHDAEHVHQLRVGLRRLRSGLKLFADDPQAAALARALADPVRELFRKLGALRDSSVLTGPIAGAVQDALHQISPGARFQVPATNGDPAAVSAAEQVRETASQQLLIDLIAASLPAAPLFANAGVTLAAGDPSNGPAAQPLSISLRKQVHRRLLRWQRAIARDAAVFDRLDAPARHKLRKHVKRLRYGAEIASGLLGRKAIKSALKPLRAAQDRLGDLNDVATAQQAFGAARERDPHLWFALGWLLARHAALLDSAQPAMRRLARSGKRWKKLG